MSTQKKRVALLMAALMIAVNVFVLHINTEASSSILVLVDNRVVIFDVQPIIINDRTMVPFAAIGTALGVTATIWDDATKTVTMYLNDDYVLLKIGNPTMNYGKFTVDNNGIFRFVTQQFLELDVAPTIVDDRTLVPLSALARGLGAGVGWDDISRTVTITSPVRMMPTPMPTLTPTPTPMPTPTPTPISESQFGDTFYFTTLSPARIQSMYDDNQKFIFIYYDSTTSDASYFIPIIKAASDYMEYDVYAMDTAGDAFINRRISFIYDFISKSMLERYSPVMFLVYGKKDVQAYRYNQLRRSSDSNTERNLIEIIDTFSYSTKSEDPEPTKDLNMYWTEIDQATATTKYNRDEDFILIAYDSVNGSSRLLQLHKEAAYDAGKNVFAIDINNISRSGHWVRGYVSGNLSAPVILVVSGMDDVRKYSRSTLEDIVSVLSGS